MTVAAKTALVLFAIFSADIAYPETREISDCGAKFGHQAQTYRLFNMNMLLVNLNAVFARLGSGDELVFADDKLGGHNHFMIQDELVRRPDLKVFDIGDSKALHLLSFRNLKPLSGFDQDIYNEYAWQNEVMKNGMELLDAHGVPHVTIHKFGAHGQFIISESFPTDTLSLRRFVDQTLNAEGVDTESYKAARQSLMAFAEASADFQSFGDISLLDNLLYHPSRGWFLLRWGRPKEVHATPRFSRGSSVFEKDLNDITSIWPDDAFEKNRYRHYVERDPTRLSYALFDLYGELQEATLRAREISSPGKTVYVESVEVMVRRLMKDADERTPEEFEHDYYLDKEVSIFGSAEKKHAVSKNGKFSIFGDRIGSYHNSELYDLDGLTRNIRVFTAGMSSLHPYTKRGVAFTHTVGSYMLQANHLRSLGLPLLEPHVPEHRHFLIEMKPSTLVTTLEDYLFAMMIGSTSELDTRKMESDLLDFAKASFRVEDISGLRLADIVYLPQRGWMLRNWDSKVTTFSPRLQIVDYPNSDYKDVNHASVSAKNLAPSLFQDAYLGDIGLGTNAISYWTKNPRNEAKVRLLFDRLRLAVQEARELEFLTPCPVSRDLR